MSAIGAGQIPASVIDIESNSAMRRFIPAVSMAKHELSLEYRHLASLGSDACFNCGSNAYARAHRDVNAAVYRDYIIKTFAVRQIY